MRILSKRYDPLYMQNALGQFFLSRRELVQGMTEVDLAERVQALITTLSDPPKTHTEESGEFWDHVLGQTDFDWTEQVIRALGELSLAEVQHAIDKWILNPETRASISVMLYGNGHKADHDKAVAALKHPLSSSSFNCDKSRAIGLELNLDSSYNEGSFFPTSVRGIFDYEEIKKMKSALLFFDV